MIGQKVWTAINADEHEARDRYKRLAAFYVDLVQLPDGQSDPDSAFNVQDDIEDGELAGVELKDRALEGAFVDRQNGTRLKHALRFEGEFGSRLSKQLVHSFWSRWHSELFIGAPIDQDVLAAIVKLKWSSWDKGPHYIARRIDQILDRDLDWRETGQVVLRQAERLLASQQTTLALVDSSAGQIDAALAEIMAAGTLNATPQVFATLQTLPNVMRQMATSIRTEGQQDKLEVLLEEFVVQLSQVASDLAKPTRLLDLTKIKETALTTTVKIGTTAFWTAFIATASHITGIVDVTEVMEALTKGAQDVVTEIDPQPSDAHDLAPNGADGS